MEEHLREPLSWGYDGRTGGEDGGATVLVRGMATGKTPTMACTAGHGIAERQVGQLERYGIEVFSMDQPCRNSTSLYVQQSVKKANDNMYSQNKNLFLIENDKIIYYLILNFHKAILGMN